MNIKCFFGDHDWKRIGVVKFINNNPFHFGGNPMAYGECRRCGKRAPREAYGTFVMDLSMTTEEAIAEWEEEYKPEQW